jgi:hypothetical protein
MFIMLVLLTIMPATVQLVKMSIKKHIFLGGIKSTNNDNVLMSDRMD